MGGMVGLLSLLFLTPEASAGSQPDRSSPVRSDSSEATGIIRGQVVESISGAPLSYANLVLPGTRLGAISGEEGEFEILDVPPGSHRVVAMMMGFNEREAEVEVVAGEESVVTFKLVRAGLNDSVAATIHIGEEVEVTADDIFCDVVPRANSFRVGDQPEFEVVMYNASFESFYLIPSLDGSTTGSRYPRVTLRIEGPENGLEMPSFIGCGFENPLGPNDFRWITPAAEFRPFETEWIPLEFQYGRFAKPGTYTVLFVYSTEESDVRRWLGSVDYAAVPQDLVSLVKKVPMLTVRCSLTFEVTE